MRALLATCLAFYSLGASGTKDRGGGRHESWNLGKHCKQQNKAALTCLDNVRGTDAEYYINQLHHVRKELRSCVKVQLERASAANQPCSARSFIYCLTQALHDKVSKNKKAGVKPFARKIKHCMRQKLMGVHARDFFVPMTTVVAGQAGAEDQTEMPFEMPLMMTTSGRTSS